MRRLFLAGLVAALASGNCAAEQAGASCMYNGRPYSEGAVICIQRSVMQSCTFDGTHAVWRTLTDTGLGDRCLGPATTAYAPQRHLHRRHVAQYQASPIAVSTRLVGTRLGSGGRCFDFAGKRYCE
jgi:hypothetical protein